MFISGHTAGGVQKVRADRGMEILHYQFIFFTYSKHLLLDGGLRVRLMDRDVCVCVRVHVLQHCYVNVSLGF